MRALLTIAFCFLLGCVAAARTQELRDAASPNGRYPVRAVESGFPSRISYDIVSVPRGALLHRFPSSYQPDEGSGDWSWEHTTDAEISWSADSRYVAIDEQVHRYIGEVLLAEVGAVTRSIRTPAKTLIARTKLDWDRYRIRIRDGWLSQSDLSLGLAGKVVTSILDDGRRTYKHIQFHFVLRLSRGKATITRLDEPEDA